MTAPTTDELFAQANAAQSALTPPPPLVPTDELFAEAQRREAEEAHAGRQLVSDAHAVNEQTDIASQIDAQRAATMQSAFDGRDLLKSIYNGAVHGAAELTISADELVTHLAGGSDTDVGLGGESHNQMAANMRGAADALSLDRTNATTAGNIAGSLSQFAVSYLSAARVFGAASAVGKLGQMALAQAAAFNPNDPRLSNLIQAHPSLANPVTEFLATQPGDSEAEGRLKNFIEGATLGVAGEAAIGGAMSVFKAMRGANGVANVAKAIEDAKPTPVGPHPEPQAEVSSPAPAVEPSATPSVAPAADLPSASSDTAGAHTVEPAAAPAAPAKFDPQAAAKVVVSVSPERAEAVRQAILDGRYADVPNMLDDTHRTIPWASLSDGPNLQHLFNAVEGEVGGLIKDAAGVKPVPLATTAQLAKDLGGNVDTVTKLFTNATSDGGLAARLTAGYNIMVASARRLKELATSAHALNLDTADGQAAVKAFQEHLELHGAIVGQVRQSTAEVGRALNALRTLKASSPVELSNIRDYVEGSVMGKSAITKLLKSVAEDQGDLASINQTVDKVRSIGFSDVLKEIVQGGLLSRPMTQVKNLAGNVAGAIKSVAERYVAAAIGKVRGTLMPSAEVYTVRAAAAHTAGMIDGFGDGFQNMVKALATEQTVSASGRQLVRAVYRGTEGRVGLDLKLSQAINLAGTAIRYPGRLMGALDNLNMAMGYNAELSSRTYLMSAAEADAKGLVGEARDTFMANRTEELRANPPKEVMAAAKDSGLYQSYQEAPQTRFGKSVTETLNAHPLVKLIIAPFVHRPANFLRQTTMDYLPTGLLSKTTRAKLFAGNADSDVAMARMVLGTTGAVAAYKLAEAGVITGARMGSRNTMSLDGVPPHSMQIGDRWYSFANLEPVGTWLTIGAEMHEAMQRYAGDDSVADQLGALSRAGVQALGHIAMEKSFMASLDQFLTMVSEKDPARQDVAAQRLIQGNLLKLVPFGGLLKGATEAVDPVERTTGGDGIKSFWQAVKAELPGLSQELPPRRDILGRPVERPGGTTAWWNPFGGSLASTDPLDVELSKVAVGIHMPPRTLPQTGVTLDAKQYDELVTLATQTKFGGKTLQQNLRDVVASDEWKRLYNTDDHGLTAHAEIVQKVIDGAYGAGEKLYIANHTEAVAAWVEKQRAKANHFAVQQ